MGRFLNADIYISTGQGLLGYNMFAYCNNNPVMCSDSSGHAACTWDGGFCGLESMAGLVDTGGGGVAGVPGCGGETGRKESLKVIQREIDFFTNTSEQAVLDAEYFAFYNGVLVIKSPLFKGCGFTFGIIFMGDDIKESNLLRHEYGHTVQMSQVGVIPYTFAVVIPSVTCFWLTDAGILSDQLYNSYPWERSADYFGSADYSHIPNSEYISSIYWLIVTAIAIG